MHKREFYTNQLSKYIDTPVIKIIKGVRRCGKSYLLRLLAEELMSRSIDSNNIIQIDFESLKYEEYRNYTSLYNFIMNKVSNAQNHTIKGKIYLLIDEIQEVTGWEKAIRSFMTDLDCDIYLTGSNARLLSGELATYLSGRYIELELYPLSFNEYIDFYQVDFKNTQAIESAFNDYLKYGGFPGLHHMPDDEDVKRQYIKGIYNSVVLKDVVQRNNIRDSELLERILIYIMDNVGQIFSAGRIADYLKSQHRKVGIESVYNYINALENAMIIYSAKRYDTKGKKILERMEKYFLVDLGLRYSMLGYRDNDISQILENIVFMELKRCGYTVYVGKEDDREIDFIAVKSDKKLYVQVTYLLATDEVVQREYLPLTKIKDNYQKIVLSLDRIPIGTKDGIEWMNVIDFIRNINKMN
ncbi:MAG: ATP-binding protein [Spirochaetales bacterium]|nr:ATP-binding protein [Spirochaetales bacterium]